MGNAQICPQREHIKYKLKLFNGVFLRRAALHTFMSAYAKVNSLNIKRKARAGRILHNIVVSPGAA